MIEGASGGRSSGILCLDDFLRAAGGKAKNGITSCHARRQLGAMEGYFWPLSA